MGIFNDKEDETVLRSFVIRSYYYKLGIVHDYSQIQG